MTPKMSDDTVQVLDVDVELNPAVAHRLEIVDAVKGCHRVGRMDPHGVDAGAGQVPQTRPVSRTPRPSRARWR